MEFSELLNNYFEGGISPNEEEQLFSEMAQNSQLRNELKDFVELERAAKSEIAAFVPPVESTMGVFNKLGISPFTTAAVATLSQIGFWGKYGKMISMNLFTVLVTGLISYFIFSTPNSDNLTENIITKYNETQVQFQSNQPNNKIPIVSNENSENESNNYSTANLRNVSNKSNFKNSKELIENENKNESFQKDQFENSENYSNSLIFTENLDKKINLSIPEVTLQSQFEFNTNNFLSFNSSNFTPFNIDFSFLDLHNISFQMSGNKYWSLDYETVERSTNPFMEDANFVVYYNVNSKFSIGIDIRQEFFFQSYRGMDEYSNQYLYEQNTNYLSYGLVGKWKIYETKHITPFVQIYLGANKVGQIGRILTGFEISPNSAYSFVLGLESSGLAYHHQKNSYYSKKLGAYYGILFNF
ncbi:MAG: hypothetical protein A2X64_06410 [Ignavibacteria bacterium GWF2_33_9]|nr:MAG: hypothetical protein A2X64_06410 [Ignavibacteria bacterium GWF2_33_9]